jgi:hypothetical protein
MRVVLSSWKTRKIKDNIEAAHPELFEDSAPAESA